MINLRQIFKLDASYAAILAHFICNKNSFYLLFLHPLKDLKKEKGFFEK
jgi:hypothetical protein